MLETQLVATIKVLGRSYVDAIVNRNGSQWNEKYVKSIDDILALNWQEFIPHSLIAMDGCRYFKAKKANIGFQQVADLREYKFSVEIKEGSHGIELVGSNSIPKFSVNVAHLILGIKDEQEIIFTAYPGEIFSSIKKFPNLSVEELKKLNIPFAVK